MPVAKFKQWSRYAVQLREKAGNGEVGFEIYREKIKKKMCILCHNYIFFIKNFLTTELFRDIL